MRPPTPSLVTLGLVAAATAFSPALERSAMARPLPQSESERTQQLQRLEQRNKQLEAELAAALERIRELEAAVKAAQSSPAGHLPPPVDGSAGSGAATPPGTVPGQIAPPPAVDPRSDPSGVKAPSSPFDNAATILDSVRSRFAADFAGKPTPREGVNDDRLARLWLTEVERWVAQVNRENRRPIIWNVRVLAAESAGRSWRMEVNCVDPATGADVGKPFMIQLQQTQASSYEQSLKLGNSGGDFALRGVYVPQLVLNPTRLEPGPFDQPPFIAPYVEYGFQIRVTSFIHVDSKNAKRAPVKSAPPAAPPATAPTPPSAPPAPAPTP